MTVIMKKRIAELFTIPFISFSVDGDEVATQSYLQREDFCELATLLEQAKSPTLKKIAIELQKDLMQLI